MALNGTADHAGVDVTNAVLQLLRDEGLRVGDGEAPSDGGWQGQPEVSAYHEYVMVWPMATQRIDGSAENPEEDEVFAFGINAYGHDREQSQRCADRVRVVFAENELQVTGRNVLAVRTDYRGSATPLEERNPREWQSSARYVVRTAAQR